MVACLCFCSAVPASAQRKSDLKQAQVYVDSGDQLFKERRFHDAVVQYTAALVYSNHHDIVWNIARCHEELEEFAQAILFFEQYQAIGVSVSDASAAEARVKRLREVVRLRQTGVLTVASSQSADVWLNGQLQGAGTSQRWNLKPGRYNVRVFRRGFEPHSVTVTIRGGQEHTVNATLKPLGKATVVVRCSVDGARISWDGSVDWRACGEPQPVVAGEHQLAVKAPSRSMVVRKVVVVAGQTHTFDVDLGPIVAPESYPDWVGEFGVRGGRFGGGLLRTRAAGAGTFTVAKTKVLRPHQAKNCSGERLTWTETYTARWTPGGAASRLVLSSGRLSNCSCPAYCKRPDDAELELIALPGREGFIDDDAIWLRTELLVDGPGAFSVATAASLEGEWSVELLNGERPLDAVLKITAETALMTLRRTGSVPSYMRNKCERAARFEQRLEVPGTVELNDRVTVRFGQSKQLVCSCEDACVGSTALGTLEGRLLVFPRYLVGRRTVLRRLATPPPP